MYKTIIYFLGFLIVVSNIILFIPGTGKLNNTLFIIDLILIAVFLLLVIILLIKFKIEGITECFKMIKKTGIKKTREYYKEQKKKEYISPEEKGRKEYFKRFFE